MSSMPTNSKTWIHSTNNVVNTGNAVTDNLTAVYNLVRFMVNSFGCSVVHCCYNNGGSLATANTDQWDTLAKVTYASTSSSRTWAVVKLPSTFGGGSVSILFDLYKTTAAINALGVKVSYSGYKTDGTTSALPTVNSGTEQVIQTGGGSTHNYNFLPYTTTKKIYNTAVSSDTQCMRFFVFNESLCTTYFEVGKIKNPVPGLTSGGKQDDNYVIALPTKAAAATDVTTYANLYTAATSNLYGNIAASGNITFQTGAECTAGGTTPATNIYTTASNPQDDNKYPLLPISLWSNTNTGYAYGRMGEIYDMWWGMSTLAIGSTFPGDGTKTHLKIGQTIVVPWNGSTPTIA